MTRPSHIVLLRHAHSVANEKGILAGRDNSVGLSDRGQGQALLAVDELESLKISRIVVSPMLRARATIAPFVKRNPGIELLRDSGINEMEYGSWSGQSLAKLSKKPLWKSIQAAPSAVTFPEGESFLEMLARSVESIHRLAKPGKTTLFVSHGDVIKAITAHFLQMHLDTFQRISIDPASITRISLTDNGAQVHTVNSTSHLKEVVARDSQSTLGGGSGASLKGKGSSKVNAR
jgi:probable phosphoglycerate mutase